MGYSSFFDFVKLVLYIFYFFTTFFQINGRICVFTLDLISFLIFLYTVFLKKKRKRPSSQFGYCLQRFQYLFFSFLVLAIQKFPFQVSYQYKDFALTGLITYRSIRLFIDCIYSNTKYSIYILRSKSSKFCCILQQDLCLLALYIHSLISNIYLL